MPVSPYSDDPTSEIASLLHERFSRLSRQLRHMQLPVGMTPERLSALSAIHTFGPISVTGLAEREMVRPATMSRMVSALVDEGLAKRQEDKTDGRGVLVAATAKGRRAYQKAHQRRLRQLADALRSFPPDQLAAMRELASALERLTLVLDE